MIMGLLPASLQLEAQGELLFDQQQLLQFNASDWENLRGSKLAWCFKSLNPRSTLHALRTTSGGNGAATFFASIK